MLTACLTDAFPTHLQDRNEAIVALLYDLGLRAQELVGLDIAHINLGADPPTVYLPTDIQKGESASRDARTRAVGRLGRAAAPAVPARPLEGHRCTVSHAVERPNDDPISPAID